MTTKVSVQTIIQNASDVTNNAFLNYILYICHNRKIIQVKRRNGRVYDAVYNLAGDLK